MGNQTNAENWAARERLRWIEVNLWWQGSVGRRELRELFGISAAQASSDLQRYQELNPNAMSYHMSRKRYEASARMRCELHEPELSDGLALFGGGENEMPRLRGGAGDDSGTRVATILLPYRGAKANVERRIVLAALKGVSLRVHYHSLSEGEMKPREIAPRFFGWDGRRWHTRAWDFGREQWLDFVLGRFEKAAWPTEGEALKLPKDEDWERWETVALKVNPKLGAKAKEALRLDYGLAGETLEVKVRAAMRPYLLAELYLDDRRKTALPQHFVLGC